MPFFINLIRHCEQSPDVSNGMRHKYDTRGIVLGRTHIGEATTYVTVLTPELGLLSARAQSLRKSGAKLAPALTTLAESALVLVRGHEGWRLAGAVLAQSWFDHLETSSKRQTAGRISGLLMRLAPAEAQDASLYPTVHSFLAALSESTEDTHEAVEIVTALRLLRTLGLDAGEMPGEPFTFTPELLREVQENRSAYVSRINHGITASGL